MWIVTVVFFESQIEIWETAFQNCLPSTYPKDAADILTYVTFTTSFSVIVFSIEILLLIYKYEGIAQCRVQNDNYFTSFYN